MTEYILPMFPLESVLFPFSVLPLRVFEPRYQALTIDVMGGSREFGVVLIERGSEVGGGDVRFAVATVGKVLEAQNLDDGGWLLIVVGTRRIEVIEWLDDDPYPRARVRDLDPAIGLDDDEVASELSEVASELADIEEVPEPGDPSQHVVAIAGIEEEIDVDQVDRMISSLRRILAMRSELNEGGVAATIEFDPFPLARVWQACAVLPVGPIDDLALLRCTSTAERVDLLQRLIDDEALVLGNRLAGGEAGWPDR